MKQCWIKNFPLKIKNPPGTKTLWINLLKKGRCHPQTLPVLLAGAKVRSASHLSPDFSRKSPLLFCYYYANFLDFSSVLKGTVSWDRFQKFWQKVTQLGLTKSRGWFFNFFGSSNDFTVQKVYLLRLMPVWVGLTMVNCLFLSVLLITSGV